MICFKNQPIVLNIVLITRGHHHKVQQKQEMCTKNRQPNHSTEVPNLGYIWHYIFTSFISNYLYVDQWILFSKAVICLLLNISMI